MNTILKFKHLKVDGIHKVLVLDKSKTSEEGQLLYVGEGSTQALALMDALDYTEMLCKTQDAKTVWN